MNDTRHKLTEGHSIRRAGGTEGRDYRHEASGSSSKIVCADYQHSESGNGFPQVGYASEGERRSFRVGINGSRRSCRACGESVDSHNDRRVGAKPKDLGNDALCARCEAGSRVSGSVEKMLAKRLLRAASFVEPEPKLDLSRLPHNVEIEDDAYNAVCAMRWPDREPSCPRCGRTTLYRIQKNRKFKCSDYHCAYQFSPLSGTAFASFKGGYVALLQRLIYTGSTVMPSGMTSKTAVDVRRRKAANK